MNQTKSMGGKIPPRFTLPSIKNHVKLTLTIVQINSRELNGVVASYYIERTSHDRSSIINNIFVHFTWSKNADVMLIKMIPTQLHTSSQVQSVRNARQSRS